MARAQLQLAQGDNAHRLLISSGICDSTANAGNQPVVSALTANRQERGSSSRLRLLSRESLGRSMLCNVTRWAFGA